MSRYIKAGAWATVSAGVRDAASDAFLAGAIQSAARSGRRGDERNRAVAFVPGRRHRARDGGRSDGGPRFPVLIRQNMPI